MADSNPLLDLYGPPPSAPEQKPSAASNNPLVSLYSSGLVPQPQGPGAPGSHENPILIQRARGQINPLANLYSPGEGPTPKPGKTIPPPTDQTPQEGVKALGKVIAPEITKVITGEQEPVPAMPDTPGKMPEVDRGYGPAVMEAITMLPVPEAVVGGKVAMAAATAAKSEELFKGVTALKNLLAPMSTPLGREAGIGLRKATGESARTTEQTRAALIPYDQAIQALPSPQRFGLLGYIEGRSKGKEFPSLMDPNLKEYADEFRNQMESRRHMIEAAGIEAGVIEDYVTHFWQDRNAAKAFVKSYMSKQGSGGSLKARTLPTIEEGIKAGLVPLTDNPTEIAMRYVTSMDRHIALKEFLNAAETAGHIQHIKEFKDVPEGWVKLGGMAGPNAYAPAEWAQIWNNFVSKGLHENAMMGDVYDAYRNVSNLTTQTILAFSGYHAVAMAKEAVASDIVKGVSEVVGGLRRGEADTVLRGAGSVATSIKAPIQKFRTGLKLRDVYLGRTPNTIDPQELPNWQKLADIYGEAGGRGVGKAHAFDYTFTPAGSFSTAWHRGWLKAERRGAPGTFTSAFKEGAQRVWDAGGERGAAYKVGAKSMATAKEITRLISRGMSTAMAPLFEKYIPMIKNGAFADEMASWLKMNPQATHQEQIAFAIKLIDSIDNRFGEMIQDNIMWHTTAKQIATIGMLSYSWNLGSLRLMAGGGKDIIGSMGRAFDPTSTHYSPNAAWIVSYPMAMAQVAAIYQFLKTGKPPESPKDLIWPQTGGMAPGFGSRSTVPERGILPGYEKEPFGWYYNGMKEAENKLNPFLRMGIQAIENANWRDDPIHRPDPTVPEWLHDYFNYVVGSMEPIGVGRMIQGEKPGSAMGIPEQLLGIRPGPLYGTDPEGYRRGMASMALQKWIAALRHKVTAGDMTQEEFVKQVQQAQEKAAKSGVTGGRTRIRMPAPYGGPQQ